MVIVTESGVLSRLFVREVCGLMMWERTEQCCRDRRVGLRTICPRKLHFYTWVFYHVYVRKDRTE